MPDRLRKQYQHQLEEIDRKVVQLFALVTEGLAAATDAFLAGDREAALEVKARDHLLDELDAEIEQLAERTLVLQSPMAGDLRFLLSVLRIVPELERSGDLAEHIASRAAVRLGSRLTPPVRGMVEEMGRIGVEMWRQAADAYADRDGTAADRLDKLDDTLDDLHAQLTAELEKGEIDLPVAMDMALVARFYERVGDHAQHITERLAYLAGTPSAEPS